MKWISPQKPAEYAEERLIMAILDGDFPVESSLPAERDLAAHLGVTRPTLREALQRMARDGWLEIHQGKPTRVKDFWRDGNLNLLGSIARYPDHLPINFIPKILHIRLLLAPAYTELAVSNSPLSVVNHLQDHDHLDDSASAYTFADFELHRYLTIESGNPIFTLILNGFSDLYLDMALKYFSVSSHRHHSAEFYQCLLKTAEEHNAQEAAQITKRVMEESIHLWQDMKEMDHKR